MRSLNKVQLIGHLGKDPETRYTPGGTAVTEFSVATSEKWKDKQTGEDKERTEWSTITCWGKLAEIAGEYLKKGAQVYVEGKLQTDKFQDRATGQDRYRTKIVAEQMLMLGNRQEGPPRQEPPHERSPERRPAGSGQPPSSGSRADDPFDDDIPF